jgi:hypothetical protein
MTTADTLDRGRECFERRAWADAFVQLSAADREASLGPEDLERLATAAYLVGRDADSEEVWARAHQEWLRLGGAERAARCAFWLALGLLSRGELARSGGWLTRAQRLLDDGSLDCVEQGYLLLALAAQRFVEGEAATAYATFGQAAKIGDRFGDRDLAALAQMGRGRALLGLGETAEGMALLDEAMVAVEAAEVSPVVAGRLLRRDPGVPGVLRCAPGAGVDGGADRLVRVAAGPGALPRSMPGASLPGHAVAGRMAGCDGGGTASPPAAVDSSWPAGTRHGGLPAGRAAPAARTVRRGRGRLP